MSDENELDQSIVQRAKELLDTIKFTKQSSTSSIEMQISYPDNVRIDLSIRFKKAVNELFGSDLDIDWTVGRICQGEKMQPVCCCVKVPGEPVICPIFDH